MELLVDINIMDADVIYAGPEIVKLKQRDRKLIGQGF